MKKALKNVFADLKEMQKTKIKYLGKKFEIARIQ